MNYEETLNYIHSLGNFSKPPTLERIKAVLAKLGNPQNNFKAIHIAGTNGKGSVSAMLSKAFILSRYKTALFISPFIIDFCERIQINSEFISRENLCKYAEIIKSTNIELTEFEFITAVAFLYFSEQNCEIGIIETGLGGRLDATNTMDNVIANVITKIGLDHTAILGDTIEKITNEKCGIIKNCPVITTVNQPSEALSVLEKYNPIIYIVVSVEPCITDAILPIKLSGPWVDKILFNIISELEPDTGLNIPSGRSSTGKFIFWNNGLSTLLISIIILLLVSNVIAIIIANIVGNIFNDTLSPSFTPSKNISNTSIFLYIACINTIATIIGIR